MKFALTTMTVLILALAASEETKSARLAVSLRGQIGHMSVIKDLESIHADLPSLIREKSSSSIELVLSGIGDKMKCMERREAEKLIEEYKAALGNSPKAATTQMSVDLEKIHADLPSLIREKSSSSIEHVLSGIGTRSNTQKCKKRREAEKLIEEYKAVLGGSPKAVTTAVATAAVGPPRSAHMYIVPHWTNTEDWAKCSKEDTNTGKLFSTQNDRTEPVKISARLGTSQLCRPLEGENYYGLMDTKPTCQMLKGYSKGGGMDKTKFSSLRGDYGFDWGAVANGVQVNINIASGTSIKGDFAKWAPFKDAVLPTAGHGDINIVHSCSSKQHMKEFNANRNAGDSVWVGFDGYAHTALGHFLSCRNDKPSMLLIAKDRAQNFKNPEKLAKCCGLQKDCTDKSEGGVKKEARCCLKERLKAQACWIYELVNTRECYLYDQAGVTNKLTTIKQTMDAGGRITNRMMYFNSRDAADAAGITAFEATAKKNYYHFAEQDGCGPIAELFALIEQ